MIIISNTLMIPFDRRQKRKKNPPRQQTKAPQEELSVFDDHRPYVYNFACEGRFLVKL